MDDFNQIIKMIRSDRASCRFAEDLVKLNSQELRAFAIGRLANELRFSMQMSWMGMNSSVRSVREIFGVIRRIVQSPLGSTKGDAIEGLDIIQQNWSVSAGSESRSDQVFEFFGVEQDDGKSLTDSFVKEVVNGSPVSVFVEQIESTVLQLFNKQCRAYYKLGEVIDQLIYPRMSSLALEILKSESMQSGRDDQNSMNHHDTNQVSLQPLRDLHDGLFEAIPLWDWLMGELRDEIDNVLRPLSIGLDLSQTWNQIAEGEKQLIFLIDLINEVLFENKSSFARRLGVSIDGNHVFRDDDSYMNIQVKLSTLPLNLFKHFLYQGASPTDLDWMTRNWGRLKEQAENEAAKPPTRNTIDKQISTLNTNIFPIDLKIENTKTNQGEWWLVDIAD